MKKIAVGPEGVGLIDIRDSVTQNLERLAERKRCTISDLTVSILDRERHHDLIRETRESGARIQLIGDGDVSSSIATAKDSGIDLMDGIGGAPEGVISAAAMKCLRGEFQGQLVAIGEDQVERAQKMGYENLDKIYRTDLAGGKVMFVATGVTDGSLLKGVKFKAGGATTHSIVMRSASGTIRNITAQHSFDRKPIY
jgi:fructose-1,6-bisphosphatase/sedoheptulose 1,7-bisphosphatase-like protein